MNKLTSSKKWGKNAIKKFNTKKFQSEKQSTKKLSLVKECILD